MSALIGILILLLLGAVVLVVGGPLRAARRGEVDAEDASPGERQRASAMPGRAERDGLEAAREAKYREIRDAELDFRTGKLSPEDYETTDMQLRAEALEILDRLETTPDGAPVPGESARPRDA